MTLNEELIEVLQGCMDYDNNSVDYDHYHQCIADHMEDFIRDNFDVRA